MFDHARTLHLALRPAYSVQTEQLTVHKVYVIVTSRIFYLTFRLQERSRNNNEEEEGEEEEEEARTSGL
jgi:hypothetical protein